MKIHFILYLALVEMLKARIWNVQNMIERWKRETEREEQEEVEQRRKKEGEENEKTLSSPFLFLKAALLFRSLALSKHALSYPVSVCAPSPVAMKQEETAWRDSHGARERRPPRVDRPSRFLRRPILFICFSPSPWLFFLSRSRSRIFWRAF